MKKFLLKVIFVIVIIPTIPLVLVSFLCRIIAEQLDNFFSSSVPSKVLNAIFLPVHVLAVLGIWLSAKIAENYPADNLHKLLRKANLQ